MIQVILIPVLAVLSLLNLASPDAQSIMETMRTKQLERWKNVENYTIVLAMDVAGGLQTPVYYERIKVDGQPTFRRVPPAEYTEEVTSAAGYRSLTPDELEEMAKGYEMLGDALATGGGDMPPMDLRGMTSDMAGFLRAGAAVEEVDSRGEAAEAVHHLEEFAKRARLVGTEPAAVSLDDPSQTREAYLLVAENLSDIELEQPEGDAEFTLQKASLWIDTEHYVPLRLLMEGEVELKKDNKTLPIQIEKLDLEYAPAGPLYESRKQVYRLSGFMAGMSEKDQKEFEKAKKELAKAKEEFEKNKEQFEQLPQAQQDMIENMMNSQMAKVEQMIEGDEISSIVTVKSIAVNEGPPTPYGLGNLTVGGPAAATYTGALTLAVERPDGSAELAITARISEDTKATLTLIGAEAFPEGEGSVAIGNASGLVSLGEDVRIPIEKGSGTITVTLQTPTRIAGTFTALLEGVPSNSTDDRSVSFSAEGEFDSGAPASRETALRGSPIPADFFDTGE